MHLLSVLLITAHFATLHAFPNFWGSESKTSSTLNSPTYDNAFVVLHPIDTNDSETIARTETSLGLICGSEHVESLQATGGDVSWKVTLTDRESLLLLAEHPWLKPDQSLKKTLVEFSRRHEKRSVLTPRDDPYYNVVAKDFNNDEETKATKEFLTTKITDPSQQILEFNLPGTSHIIGWGHVQLSDAAKGEVEAYQGVTAPLGTNDLIEEDRAVTYDEGEPNQAQQKSKLSDMVHTAYSGVVKRVPFIKRAVTWTKQQAAPWELVMVSRPKEMKDDQLNDFVYDTNAGDGTWIYVIDSGVAYNLHNVDKQREFPKAEPLQTKNSKDAGEREDADDSNIHHGTMVASKALGQKYGVAKKATLVSVKCKANPKGARTEDFIQALDRAVDHLAEVEHADRRGKTVIISSLGLSNNEGDANLMRPIFEKLFEMGIPFISSAGNTAPLIPDISKLPKLLEGPEMPIINVGAVDRLRQKALYSQAGPHLTLYAPGGFKKGNECTKDGECIKGQSKDDTVEREDAGTSFAAPLVAGVIATYFNYDPAPWDGSKTGKPRVQAIKEFLVSDASSWDDTGKLRTIWNGATKTDHQSAGAINQEPPPDQPQNEGRTFVVGLEQTASPDCEWLVIPGINTINTWSCSGRANYFNKLFFYRLENHENGVDSLCTSELRDFSIDEKGVSRDEGFFEQPKWPGGEWPLKLFGEDFTYRNNGENPGALWKEGRADAITCSGDLSMHDPQSEEWCEHSLTGDAKNGKNMKRRRLLACTW